jgi:predicted AlkP superfamily pyrophosphatase or phosphodiesterase
VTSRAADRWYLRREIESVAKPLLLLTIPGLRPGDLAAMPRLMDRCRQGTARELIPSFPAVTWPVQTNLLTGCLPAEHGIVANGLYDRGPRGPVMWTLGNRAIERPQLWDVLQQPAGALPALHTGSWFPMLARDCGAELVCMPAPIHNPDGSESLWCYSKPTMLYGELRDALGHFPLKHFWGPLAGMPSSRWILESAVVGAKRSPPDFFYIYVPHLDYAAQKLGPESPQAVSAVGELDGLLDGFFTQMDGVYPEPPTVLVVGEYPIVPVDHVCFPNRKLREAGLLRVLVDDQGREQLDFAGSAAWALVDHQFSHVFVRDAAPAIVKQVADLMRSEPGIEEILVGAELARYGLNHPRSGELVLVSSPQSWQAYYWWEDDARAPAYARTVDIHRKPGYDPVELHFDPQTKGIPLDARLIRGSHGAPCRSAAQRTVAVSSDARLLATPTGLAVGGSGGAGSDSPLRDLDLHGSVLRHFGR